MRGCNLSWKAVADEMGGYFGLFMCPACEYFYMCRQNLRLILVYANISLDKLYLLRADRARAAVKSCLKMFVVGFQLGSIPG
jgi:hypothetical protein